jgi:hypothetical protein
MIRGTFQLGVPTSLTVELLQTACAGVCRRKAPDATLFEDRPTVFDVRILAGDFLDLLEFFQPVTSSDRRLYRYPVHHVFIHGFIDDRQVIVQVVEFLGIAAFGLDGAGFTVDQEIIVDVFLEYLTDKRVRPYDRS